VILALETSCDDTCAAVVTRDGEILANVISSQGIHDRYGGVVPEIASRHHLTLVDDAVADALRRAGGVVERLAEHVVAGAAVLDAREERVPATGDQTDEGGLQRAVAQEVGGDVAV
jgi:hypothetical protein